MKKREIRNIKYKIREAGGKSKIVGAILYDRPADVGGWIESIRAGAFAGSLENVSALWSHDPSKPLASTSGGTLRLTDSDTELAFEIDINRNVSWGRDALAAIERGDAAGLSFGFRVNDEKFESDVREIISGELIEISPVTFPAYPENPIAARSTAGGGLTSFERISPMNNESIINMRNDVFARIQSLAAKQKLSEAEKRDAARLKADFDRYSIELGDSGLTFSELKSVDAVYKGLNAPAGAPSPRAPISNHGGATVPGAGEFSLVAHIRAQLDPRYNSPELERNREISAQLATATGMESRGGGLVPMSALVSDERVRKAAIEQRLQSVNPASAGGDLFGGDFRDDLFIDILRDATVVGQAGAQIISGLTGDVILPQKTAGTTGEWVLFDGLDSLSESDMALAQKTMAPKFLATLSAYSYKLFTQTGSWIETLLRNDMMAGIAVMVDHAILTGTDVKGPSGIVFDPDINRVTPASAVIEYDELLECEAKIGQDFGLSAIDSSWAINSAVRKQLRQLFPKDPGGVAFSQSPVMNAGASAASVIGYKSYITEALPGIQTLFGNFRNLLVGTWAALDLLADPYSKMESGIVRLRAVTAQNYINRYPQSFCLIDDFTAAAARKAKK